MVGDQNYYQRSYLNLVIYISMKAILITFTWIGWKITMSENISQRSIIDDNKLTEPSFLDQYWNVKIALKKYYVFLEVIFLFSLMRTLMKKLKLNINDILITISKLYMWG